MSQLPPLTAVLLECARLESHAIETEEVLEILREIRASLKTIFRTIAEALAASPRWTSWAADPEHPGYLACVVDDLRIRAPWNLLADIPPPEVLSELAGLAHRIRSGPETVICLSGSSAIYSAVQAIGDLDFCEYVEQPGLESTNEERSFKRTVCKVAPLDDGDLACVELKILESVPPPPKGKALVRRRPWDPPPVDDLDFLGLAEGAVAAKCDFIAWTRFEGVLEMTNVVLFIHSDQPEAGAGRRSFPPQEALLAGPGAWVPRRLEEPRSLGRYVNWLQAEILRLLTPENLDLAKATKRALALTRLLSLEDQGKKLLEILEDRRLTLGSALCARLALRSKLRAPNADPSLLRFEAPLLKTIFGLVERLGDEELQPPDLEAEVETVDLWCRRALELLGPGADRYRAAREIVGSIAAKVSGLP